MLDRLKNIFARRRIKTSPDGSNIDHPVGQGAFWQFAGGSNEPTPLLSPEDSLQISAAWRCVNIVSGALASIPWQVVVRTEQGEIEFPQHPIYRMLSVSPNPEMTPVVFKETMISHVLKYGNAYAEIVRDQGGRPVEIYPIPPDRVEPIRDDFGDLYYRVTQAQDAQVIISPNDIFHVPGLSWDGVKGYSVFEVAAQNFRTAARIDHWTGKYFRDAMNPSGVITAPAELELSPAAMENMFQSFKRSIGSNAHRPFVAAQGMDYKPISHTPEQAQFLETRLFIVREMCRLFGVPPYMVFASDAEPRANVEQQNREFMNQTLMPLGTKFEQEANRKLIMFPKTYQIKIDYKSYTRGDNESRVKYYKDMRAMGAMTINEVRRLEGLPAVDERGDKLTMQAQYRVVEEDGNPSEITKSEPTQQPNQNQNESQNEDEQDQDSTQNT